MEDNLTDASEIVAVAVYPSIGIARVGNAPGGNNLILASEVIGGLPAAPGGIRDESGKIMRQAVRFRLYARTKAGEVVEVTAEEGVQIEWRVAVANLKADMGYRCGCHRSWRGAVAQGMRGDRAGGGPGLAQDRPSRPPG
jgi:hypothetical protein